MSFWCAIIAAIFALVGSILIRDGHKKNRYKPACLGDGDNLIIAGWFLVIVAFAVLLTGVIECGVFYRWC